MATFKDVIRAYAQPVETPGGADEISSRRPRQRPPFDAERLRADLQRVRTTYMVWFTICIGMAVIAIAAGLTLALNQAGPAAVPVSVSGLSTCGLLAITARLLRTRGQIDLLLTLASGLDREILRAIVSAIRL
jgi:hypothetical protein